MIGVNDVSAMMSEAFKGRKVVVFVVMVRRA